MRTLLATFAAVTVAALASANGAFAQTTYEISVELDDSTAADDDLLSAAALLAPDGEAAQSIRKLAAGVTGEIQILLHQRLQGDVLTLDDGTSVTLFEEDAIKAKKKIKKCTEIKCEYVEHGAQIYRGKGVGKPWMIVIPSGDCHRVINFITKTGTGKPEIYTTCEKF